MAAAARAKRGGRTTRMVGARPGCQPDLGRDRAGQGQHSPEIADEIAPLIHGGMMRGQFPGAGFSGTSTRLQWIAHQDPVGHTRSFGATRTRPQWCGWVVGGGGVREPPTFSENPGEFSSPSQNPGSHRHGILGFLHHETASFAGAPITDDKMCHVTQPRARINVSCSRADHNCHKRPVTKVMRRENVMRRDHEGCSRRYAGY